MNHLKFPVLAISNHPAIIQLSHPAQPVGTGATRARGFLLLLLCLAHSQVGWGTCRWSLFWVPFLVESPLVRIGLPCHWSSKRASLFFLCFSFFFSSALSSSSLPGLFLTITGASLRCMDYFRFRTKRQNVYNVFWRDPKILGKPWTSNDTSFNTRGLAQGLIIARSLHPLPSPVTQKPVFAPSAQPGRDQVGSDTQNLRWRCLEILVTLMSSEG